MELLCVGEFLVLCPFSVQRSNGLLQHVGWQYLVLTQLWIITLQGCSNGVPVRGISITKISPLRRGSGLGEGGSVSAALASKLYMHITSHNLVNKWMSQQLANSSLVTALCGKTNEELLQLQRVLPILAWNAEFSLLTLLVLIPVPSSPCNLLSIKAW